MKKLWCMMAVVGLVLAVGISVSAHEASTSANDDGSYTTSGILDQGASRWVTIVVHSGNEITVDSIEYIDQAITDENGAFSFTYRTRQEQVAGSPDYYVKIRGTSLEQPISAGVIEAPDYGFSASGMVTCMGDKTKVNIKAVSETGTQVSGTVREDGSFEIPGLLPGNYDIVASKKAHFAASVQITVVEGQNTDGIQLELIAGDINQNGSINMEDLDMIITDYGLLESSPGFDTAVDINDSGSIDLLDATALISNFGKVLENE